MAARCAPNVEWSLHSHSSFGIGVTWPEMDMIYFPASLATVSTCSTHAQVIETGLFVNAVRCCQAGPLSMRSSVSEC